MSGGTNHSLAIKSDGTLWAWGYNYYGQLGDGTRTNRTVPTQESSASREWSSVSGGTNHSLAIKSDVTLWAWGNNGNGQVAQWIISPKLSIIRE